ncbi:YeiH family protein [Finegoldia magna]|uniref:YeiH family protein n=1 Tax=Finegoldia magna TaxID=1260 RepID=UPI000D716414|nr:YeiH family protein [Finegoldia magna]MCC3310517.1 YeiH family protein [Finegoldia magna]PWV46660.1 putative integral membrane protein (TIGR00698 family) [Finegoldia magna]
MNWLNKNYKGLLLCLLIAIPCHFLGKKFPVIGGAVLAILVGIVMGYVIKDKSQFEVGMKFASKKILQYAVILLGFGMNLAVVMETGKQSLPIIILTISTSLIISYVLAKKMNIAKNIAILVGVGSSICGGSAIAATAPVIEADDEDVAQAISVIFFFNVIAALIFPLLGSVIGFSTNSGKAFGIFAGTAVNDTSSVTAAAATWDGLYNLGTQTLDKAVTVKLTRTLAIIPITLVLSYLRTKKQEQSEKVELKKIFPMFILYFVLASIITTVALKMGVDAKVFNPLKELSKFFIVMAMAAIGFKTDIVKLIKTGGKPILLGFCCWIGIAIVSIAMQFALGLI